MYIYVYIYICTSYIHGFYMDDFHHRLLRSTFKMKPLFRQSASGTFPKSWTSTLWNFQLLRQSIAGPATGLEILATDVVRVPVLPSLFVVVVVVVVVVVELHCSLCPTPTTWVRHIVANEILGDSQVKAEDATQAEKKTPLLKGGDTLGGTWGMHLQ